MAFLRRRSNPHKLREAFLARYAGRHLILHGGLDPFWVEELLKEPGGMGHFRIDLRQQPGKRPTPVEWVAHEQIAPLGLPHPLLAVVDRQGRVTLRHLTREEGPIHPSELAWMRDELDDRFHARLHPDAEGGFTTEWGIPVADNTIETDYGFTLG
jgi:hypothetical protein